MMIFLALKHILSRKKQSLVTLLGIFIGTMSYIVISSFFQASQDSMIASMVSGDPHIRIQAREREIDSKEIEDVLYPMFDAVIWKRTPSGVRASAAIENSRGWMDFLATEPSVVAATRVHSTTALINYNKVTYSVNVTGADPREQVKITNIEENMVSGSVLDLNKGTARVVIGQELANLLAKQVGDNLVLTSVKGSHVPFKIVGIFSTGNKFSDRSSAYTQLYDAQKLGGDSGKISQIYVKVSDFRQASALASDWQINSQDRVRSWDQINENLLSMFKTQDVTRYTITGIIMLVAGFSIYNILGIVVTQKRKDIAILRSMGYEPGDITLLFLYQGLILGLFGGLLGCAVGYLISIGIGEVSMGGPRSTVFHLDFSWDVYLIGILISNVVAILASYFPARSASKLSPIEIIRGTD
ncbi:MAG: ABC transporter permease [Bdellovibrionaceae bacterium]|nr:ABC transporter permease [Pseudobdellovibrionaceae bacterium]